ncbi:hypothetical protein BJY52DRAFT_1196234 [Lactarius psammicola]|nr:hypothetical protein BJY52DRAFT_1196234 [Lactarius psammicola]
MSPPPPPYTCWASAEEWRAGFVILGANVDSILAPPPRSAVIIGADGFWGAHEWTVYPQPHRPEFPYLAWIPLHSSMWKALPTNSNIHVIDPDVLDGLTVKWKSLKATLQDPFNDISSHPNPLIQRPMKAYTRGLEALSRLGQVFAAWRDFVEVFRNLQQSLLELQAFLDWWKDICASNDFRSPVRAPTRGAIFEDAQIYANYARWSPRRLRCRLANYARYSPCPSSPSYTHFLTGIIPLLVCDVVTELETAARGYAERLDPFNPTKEVKRKLEKRENRMSDEAGRRAKRAKTDTAFLLTQMNNQGA